MYKTKKQYSEGDHIYFKSGGGTFMGVINSLDSLITDLHGIDTYWVWETTAGFRQSIQVTDILGMRDGNNQIYK